MASQRARSLLPAGATTSSSVLTRTAVVQLPVLEVDGQCVAQTGSILRYISQLAGKAGHGISGAQADAAFEAAQETAMAQIYTAVNLMEEPLARSTAAKFRAHLPQYLTNWTHALRQGPYFHGVAILSLHERFA